MTRIELALSAWEAEVLPLNYIRIADIVSHNIRLVLHFFKKPSHFLPQISTYKEYIIIVP